MSSNDKPSYEWLERSRIEYKGYVGLVKYTTGYYRKSVTFYRAFLIDTNNTIHKGKVCSNLLDAITHAGLMIADAIRAERHHTRAK